MSFSFFPFVPWRMTSWASGGRSWKGVRRSKWYSLARASKYIRAMESPFTFCQPETAMAPSRMDRAGLGITSWGSAFIWLPRPVQVGQAPKGLLKENIRGESSSMEMPQSSQA